MTTTKTVDEMVAAIKAYASDNKCHFEPQGECGFGRECVGLGYGDQWVSYDEDGSVWCPDDAYHKANCTAVLGRGDEAVRQLFEWVEWFKANGYVVRVVPRKFYNESGPGRAVEAMLHGLTDARMVKEGAK